jgi:hypothetical protein
MTSYAFGNIQQQSQSYLNSDTLGTWPYAIESPYGNFSRRGGLNITQRGGLYFTNASAHDIAPQPNLNSAIVDTEAWHSTFTTMVLQSPILSPSTYHPRVPVNLGAGGSQSVSPAFNYERSAINVAPTGIDLRYRRYNSVENTALDLNPILDYGIRISASGFETSAESLQFGNVTTGFYRFKASPLDVDLEKYDPVTDTWKATVLSTGASSVTAVDASGTSHVVEMNVTSTGNQLSFTLVTASGRQGCSISLGPTV